MSDEKENVVVEAAAHLLANRPRHRTEGNVQSDVEALLRAMRVGTIESHYQLGSDQADIYLPNRRTFIECKPYPKAADPERPQSRKTPESPRLVIDRGIAHTFDNLVGMVTLNQPRLFLDLANPDFNRVVDVLNVPRGASNFPTLRVNRYRTPAWLCRFTRKMQRLQLRANPHSAYPFRFATREGNITLLPREKGKP